MLFLLLFLFFLSRIEVVCVGYSFSDRQWCGSERLLFGSGSDLEIRIRILSKTNWIILNIKIFFIKLCRICFVRIQIVFFFIHNFLVTYITKYIFNLLYYYFLCFFMTFYGRIRIRQKGSDPSRSGSETLAIGQINLIKDSERWTISVWILIFVCDSKNVLNPND